MKLLIGNSTVELNFSSRQEALNTRAKIVMSYEEIDLPGFFQWEQICRKYPYIKKSYDSAK